MSLLFDQDYQVSGSSTTFAHISFSAHAQLHSFLNAGGYFQRYHFFAIHSSFAFTNVAFIGDNGAFSITIGAGSHRLHLS